MNILVSLGIFLFVFFTPLDTTFNKYGGTYVPLADTETYLRGVPLDPWQSIRTPGYPLFLAPFLEPHREQMEGVFNKTRKLPWIEVFSAGKRFPEFINAAGLQDTFDNIVLCQRLLRSICAAFLVFTFSLYFNPIVVGACFLLGIRFVPLVNPAFLLTESVAQPLSFLAIGFLLLASKKKNFFFLFLATLCASYMYLVRPAGIYMIGLCGISWIYFFWKERFRHVAKFLLSATGFLPAVVYIIYISTTSGYLIFGTYPVTSDLQFACFFLEPEDIDNMPTLRSKEYARIFMEKKSAAAEERTEGVLSRNFAEKAKTRSFGYRYSMSAWGSAFSLKNDVLKELAKNPQIGRWLSLKEMVGVGRELKIGVLKRHPMDFILTVGRNILTGFGYYRDFNSSALAKYGFKKIIGGWCIWILALLVCPRVRFCLFLPGAAHLLHVFAVSYGNFIKPWYMNLTESLYLFAVLLSLWALLDRLLRLCSTIYEDKSMMTDASQ